MKTYTALTMVCAMILAGAFRAQAATVVNPRVTTDSSVDCSSAEAVVKQITKPDMTDEQKAIACWRFMLDHFYHWQAPAEEDGYEKLRDFGKAINSYGFGPCYVNAPVMTALWEAAGLETRVWTLTGHTIPEVKYGGTWHLLDADARGWHRKDDGQIASVEELANNPKLFTEPKEKSDPYYPYGAPDAVAKPFEHWPPAGKLMDAYASKQDNYMLNRRAVMGHPMYLTLRQGETIVRSATNEGKWYVFPGASEKDKVTGPVEVDKKVTYGNGHLTWQPDLKTIPASDLLWLGSKNVRLAEGRLSSEKEGAPATAVFRVWCPYVLVESKAELVAQGMAGPKVEVSNDGGASWQESANVVWAAQDGGRLKVAVDLTARVAGRYEYLLRLTSDRLALTGVSFDSTFQLAPLALPRLKAGRNKVTIFRGPDEGHVQLVLGPGRVAKERYIAQYQNIAVPKNLSPLNAEEPGFAVYKLTAPAELTALSLGANFTFDAGKNQHLECLYSLDDGKTWTTAFKRGANSNRDNYQFEADKRLPLDNPAGSKEALVKIMMKKNPNNTIFGVYGLRLYAFYRQPQPADARLDVELAWQEKNGGRWQDKKKAWRATAFPSDVELNCGGEAVRLSRMEMTPAPIGGNTLEVGPGKRFAKPSEAIAAAKDGDTIEIASGDYTNDWSKIWANNLTIRGVGERRPRLISQGMIDNGKGIFVPKGRNLTVENIEFIGARVADRFGSGIRDDGRNLTVRGCRFYDCEHGICGGAGEMLVEGCEFDHCGHSAGSVATHSLYIFSQCTKLTFRGNYSTHTLEGHLLKTCSGENWILNNRITDEEGMGSAVVDIPYGGLAVVSGNILHKGPNAHNNRMIAFGMQGLKYDTNDLYVVNNSMWYELAKPGDGSFVRVETKAYRDKSSPADTPDRREVNTVIVNNVCVGTVPLTNARKFEESGNLLLRTVAEAGFVDGAKYDFHLVPGSPCIDRGVDPGKVGEFSLRPERQYVHPAKAEKRPDDGRLDVGALEFVRPGGAKPDTAASRGMVK